MLLWFNRYNKQRKVAAVTHTEMARKNREHLVREKVSLQYDVIRSIAR